MHHYMEYVMQWSLSATTFMYANKRGLNWEVVLVGGGLNWRGWYWGGLNLGVGCLN